MSRCISLDFQKKKRSFLAGVGFSLALFSWAALGVDGAGGEQKDEGDGRNCVACETRKHSEDDCHP